jgi:hypothetical protein
MLSQAGTPVSVGYVDCSASGMHLARSADIRPRSADFRAGLIAGLIAGLVDEILITGLALAQGASPWTGMKGVAAMALGPGVLEASDAFHPGIFVAAMTVHFLLSIVFGLIAAGLIRNAPAGFGLLIGLLFGLAIYTIDFYLFAPLYFPWMTAARAMPAVIATHAIFGVVLSAAYLALRHGERRSGIERRIWMGQADAGRRRLRDRRHPPVLVPA